jgi:hypothetical protein
VKSTTVAFVDTSPELPSVHELEDWRGFIFGVDDAMQEVSVLRLFY